MISKYSFTCFLFAPLILLIAGNLLTSNAQERPEIRLVLQVTVDGLHADLLNRYQAGFGEEGFNLLLREYLGSLLDFTPSILRPDQTQFIKCHFSLRLRPLWA